MKVSTNHCSEAADAVTTAVLAFPSATQQRSIQPRRWIWRTLFGLLFAVLAGLAAWDGLQGWAPPPRKLETTTVEKRLLEWDIPFHGELNCQRMLPCVPTVEGHAIPLAEIQPDGSYVTKGQPIGRFDLESLKKLADELEQTATQLRSQLKLAREELKQLELKATNDKSKAQLNVELAELDRQKYLNGDFQVELEDRRMTIALATRELEETLERLEHYRNFVRKGFGTPEQLRVKEIEATRAQYNLLREKARLMVLEKFTRKRQESDLNARVEHARCELDRTITASQTEWFKAQSELTTLANKIDAEVNKLNRVNKVLANPVVQAPYTGYLVYLPAQDTVPRPSSSSITTSNTLSYTVSQLASEPRLAIVESSPMTIRAFLNRKQTRLMRIGQKVHFSLDYTPPVEIVGIVKGLNRKSETEIRPEEIDLTEYLLTIEIPQQQRLPGLLNGLAVEGTVHVKTKSPQPVLPINAIYEQGSQCFVFVYLDNEQIEKRAVTVGERNQNEVIILQGLETNEKVILSARLAALP